MWGCDVLLVFIVIAWKVLTWKSRKKRWNWLGIASWLHRCYIGLVGRWDILGVNPPPLVCARELGWAGSHYRLPSSPTATSTHSTTLLTMTIAFVQNFELTFLENSDFIFPGQGYIVIFHPVGVLSVMLTRLWEHSTKPSKRHVLWFLYCFQLVSEICSFLLYWLK